MAEAPNDEAALAIKTASAGGSVALQGEASDDVSGPEHKDDQQKDIGTGPLRRNVTNLSEADKPYSAFSEAEKWFIIVSSATAAIFSWVGRTKPGIHV